MTTPSDQADNFSGSTVTGQAMRTTTPGTNCWVVGDTLETNFGGLGFFINGDENCFAARLCVEASPYGNFLAHFNFITDWSIQIIHVFLSLVGF